MRKTIWGAAFLGWGALPSGSAQATDYRLEGGIGGAFGSNSAKATVTTGGTSVGITDNSLNGSGLGASAALWADSPLAYFNPMFSNFSFGIEYRHYGNSESGNASVSLPGGSVTGSVNGDFTTDNLMFDAAWRLNTGGALHPFIGGGGGIAFANWSGTLHLTSSGGVGVPSSLSAGITATEPAGHVFVGIDYDITPNIYVGAVGDYYFTDTITKTFTHTSIQMDVNQGSVLAHAGFKF